MKKTRLEWTVREGFVTEFARRRFQKTGDVNVGVHALEIMVPGIPAAIAESVVRGSKKLVGTKELRVEDDAEIVEPPSWIKPCDITSCSCGWISPGGEVFGHVGYNERDNHEVLAEKIVARQSVRYNGHSFYTSVEDAGYIKFSPDRAITSARSGEVTEAQYHAVLRYVEARGLLFFQLGPNACGRVTPMELRKMDLLQFGKMISIHF